MPKRKRRMRLGRGVKEPRQVPWITAPGGLLYNLKHGLPPGTPAPPKQPKVQKPRKIEPPKRNLPVIYNPYNIRKAVELGQITEADVKKEYTRLRKMMDRRLAALKKAGREESRFYKYNLGRYGKISELSPGHLRDNLARMYHELISEDATVYGQDEARRKHEEWLKLLYGIEFENPEDWGAFKEMLDYVREGAQEAMYYKVIMQALGVEGIQNLYKQWKENRFDPLNPPDAYVQMAADVG